MIKIVKTHLYALYSISFHSIQFELYTVDTGVDEMNTDGQTNDEVVNNMYGFNINHLTEWDFFFIT